MARALILLAVLLAGCGSELVTLGSDLVNEPPPPPPVQKCFDEKLGGGSSCKDMVTWKAAAADACAKQGLTIVSLEPVSSCGVEEWTVVTYRCCAP